MVGEHDGRARLDRRRAGDLRGWNPARVAAGAFLFGAVEAGQFRLQGINVPVSSFFLNMLPYIFTIVVLVLSTLRTRRLRIGQPAALGKAYIREER